MKRIALILIAAIAASACYVAMAELEMESFNNAQFNKHATSRPFVKGLEAFDGGDFELADRWFAEEVGDHPDNGYALCNQGVARAENGYGILLKITTTNFDSLGITDIEGYAKKEFEKYKSMLSEGIELLHRGEKALPADDKLSRCRAWIDLSKLYEMLSDDENADSMSRIKKECLDNAVNIYPGEESLLARADYYSSQGDSLAHAADVLKAAEVEPNVKTLCAAALLYIMNEDQDNAISYLQKANDIDPGNTAVLSVLALLATDKNNNAEALRYYDQSAHYEDPPSCETMQGRSKALSALGDNSAAASDAVAALLTSNFSEDDFLHVIPLYRKAPLEVDRAFQRLKAFAQLGKNEIDVSAAVDRCQMAAAACSGRPYEKVAALLDKQKESDDADLHIMCHDIALVRGDTVRAKEFLGLAIAAKEKEDDSVEKYEKLMQYAIRAMLHGDTGLATDIGEKACEGIMECLDEDYDKDAVQSNYNNLYGKMLYVSGRYEEALAALGKVKHGDEVAGETFVETQVVTGQCHQLLGNNKKAAECFKQAEKELKPVLKEGLNESWQINALATALAGQGKNKQALKEIDKFDKGNLETEKPSDYALYFNSTGSDYYNMACACSVAGDVDNALAWLEKQFELGNFFRYYRLALLDNDLLSVRKDPRFEALYNKYFELWQQGRK